MRRCLASRVPLPSAMRNRWTRSPQDRCRVFRCSQRSCGRMPAYDVTQTATGGSSVMASTASRTNPRFYSVSGTSSVWMHESCHTITNPKYGTSGTLKAAAPTRLPSIRSTTVVDGVATPPARPGMFGTTPMLMVITGRTVSTRLGIVCRQMRIYASFSGSRAPCHRTSENGRMPSTGSRARPLPCCLCFPLAFHTFNTGFYESPSSIKSCDREVRRPRRSHRPLAKTHCGLHEHQHRAPGSRIVPGDCCGSETPRPV